MFHSIFVIFSLSLFECYNMYTLSFNPDALFSIWLCTGETINWVLYLTQWVFHFHNINLIFLEFLILFNSSLMSCFVLFHWALYLHYLCVIFNFTYHS
jgi:hypothetical protein